MSDRSDEVTVIVGAGQAGSELAMALREAQHPGRIVLIGDESHVAYRRPPLSKAFLAGQASRESLYIRPRATYEKHGIECMTDTRVASIDRAARKVRLASGAEIRYSKLALTTGGRPRRLAIAEGGYGNVHYVRTIGDIENMRPGLQPGCRMVIVGGGYIGLEIAAVAAKLGLHVTVVEAMARVLARVAHPVVSAFYERVHRDHGVVVHTGAGVHAFEGEHRVTAVVLTDQTCLPADLVVIGIGLVPNAELAEAAGLEVADGIVVDRFSRTSDPDIVAAGDCTQHDNGFLGRRLRLESVPNAVEQARVAAATLCGRLEPYEVAPWFWSDQYDLKLQMVGVSAGHDTAVVRGDVANESFCVLYLRDGVLIAADTINRPHEFMLAKRLVAKRLMADAACLADETVSLKSLLPGADA